jgi:hypothetical protein
MGICLTKGVVHEILRYLVMLLLLFRKALAGCVPTIVNHNARGQAGCRGRNVVFFIAVAQIGEQVLIFIK